MNIRVITKLPNTEQSSKGKGKTHKSTNRHNQSTTGKLGKRNGPDLVQAFPKKSWVESDFTAPLFCRNVPYLTLLNSFVFVHRKSKMATDAGRIKKYFISETRYLIEPKLNMSKRWVVP